MPIANKDLVVGTDDSYEARAAGEVAAQLGDRLGLRVVLAHVVGAGASDAARDRASRLLAAATPPHAERRLLEGDPAPALAAFAQARDAAMTVVGSRGRSPAKATLFGSVSRALLRLDRRPLMIVSPAAARAWSAGFAAKLVCGVDGSREAVDAANAAVQLAALGRYELVLASVTPHGETADELLAQTERLAAARGVAVSTRRVGDEPVDELNRLAEEERASLLIAGTRRSGTVVTSWWGTTSAALAASASRPVLLVSSPSLAEDERHEDRELVPARRHRGAEHEQCPSDAGGTAGHQHEDTGSGHEGRGREPHGRDRGRAAVT